jgi:trimeric autotransporter adhesin
VQEDITPSVNNTFVGAFAGGSSTGVNNTFVGQNAGQSNIARDRNIYVGNFSDVSLDNFTYANAIGNLTV